MTTAYIILGSNIGDKKSWIDKAILKISSICEVTLKSSLYESEAWGGQTESYFINQVIELKTNDSAHKLLEKLLNIELELGRVRDPLLKYGERIIDVDILLFGNEIINSDKLSIPHPRMQDRKFVLVPLSELAKDIIHPRLNVTIESLLKSCSDTLDVTNCNN